MADLNNLLGNLDEEDNDDNGHLGKEKSTGIYDDDDDEDIFTKNKKGSDLFYQDGIVNDQGILTPFQRLKLAWKQELACPELLPYDHEVIDYFMELLATQEDVIDNVQQGGVLSLSNTNTNSAGIVRNTEANQMLTSLSVNILKMEVDRIRFILADLSRTRIQKIEKYALHSRTLLDRMSDEEVRLRLFPP